MKPGCINILGKTYKIKYEDKSKTDACGLTDNAKALIIIDKSLTGKDLEQTPLHEFFHGVFHRVGANQAIAPELEEIIVESIANFLVDIYDFHLE